MQFVHGLHTLYDAGARVFVEVGPKRALHGFVEDVLGEHDDVLALFTNHPKLGDVGVVQPGAVRSVGGRPRLEAAGRRPATAARRRRPSRPTTGSRRRPAAGSAAGRRSHHASWASCSPTSSRRGCGSTVPNLARRRAGARSHRRAGGRIDAEPVVVTGAALGLPGVEQVFDDDNIARILDGQQFIDAIPDAPASAMVDMHITRLVKSESGGPSFETIDDQPRSSSSPAAARRSTSSSSSASTPPATRRSTTRPGWPSAPGSTRCATPESRW